MTSRKKTTRETTKRSKTKSGTVARPGAAVLSPAEATMLASVATGGEGRPTKSLTDAQRDMFLAFLCYKRSDQALDLRRLIPQGSIIARVVRHFRATDISYAMPVFQMIMLAASHLTQAGASLDVPGLGPILPTLWTIGLAESGSSKTLAADRIMSMLSDDEMPPVRRLSAPGSDAQWIEDLAANNGAFWFQDEAGKFLQKVLRDSRFARIKPWMLDAYSHQPISNRLKSEQVKTEIGKPAFTFYGLTVFSSWKTDIDATSMLDGFCQRFNYFVAPRRTDTTMFDHFLYFSESWVPDSESDIRELWHALCAQPGADGPYTLEPEVLPYLRSWWKDLGGRWAGGAVPDSFVRRIGFSVMKYLVALQFLLGKAARPIDVETAMIASRFAEYHLESARIMLEGYDMDGAAQVQKIVEIRDRLIAAGTEPTWRNITRKMSTPFRKSLPPEMKSLFTELLEQISAPSTPDLFGAADPGDTRTKSAAIMGTMDEIEKRLALTERKRNERRLRNLRNAHRARLAAGASEDVASRPAQAGTDWLNLLEAASVALPEAPAPGRPDSLRFVRPTPEAEATGFALEWPTEEDFDGPGPRLH